MSTKPRALFVTDLDGTLITRNRELPDRNREAILSATEAGVTVAIVTGRRRSSVKTEYPKLEGLSYRVATSNGAVVLKPDNDAPEFVRCMAWHLVEDVASRDEYKHADLFCITAPAMEENGDEETPDCFILEAQSRRWLTSWTPYKAETLQTARREQALRKCLVHAAFRAETRDEAERMAWRVRRSLPTSVSIHVVQSPVGPGALMEFVPSGGKGLAIGHLLESLGVPREASGAIGDELNDDDLLDAAEHRYVVGGSVLARSRPDALEVSPVGDGAVADAIDDFLRRLG